MTFFDGLVFFSISTIAFIVAIVILVTFHEFGHFWVARKLGVKVLRFSIGFGKPFWKRIVGKDPVEFVLAPIPLGGYVKLLDERDPDIEIPEDERHRAFNNAPIWKRVAILLAGPVFNFIFAVFAFWLLAMMGIVDMKVVVDRVTPDSYAAHAGLQEGHEIIAIGDESVANWEGVLIGMMGQVVGDGQIRLTTRDDTGATSDVLIEVTGQESELTKPGALLPGLGIQPWRPTRPAIVAGLSEGMPAEAAGFQLEDRIVIADGVEIASFSDLSKYVQSRPGQRIVFAVERGGVRQEIVATPASSERQGQTVGVLGIQGANPRSVDWEDIYPEMYTVKQYGPVSALSAATRKTAEMSLFTVRMLWNMIAGPVSKENIAGPITIATYAGYTVTLGFEEFLRFLAVVSISLGILNLLPIPMLDGGQIAYQLAEFVKGAPVSERARLFGQQIGIAMLVLIIGFAIFNDIGQLVK